MRKFSDIKAWQKAHKLTLAIYKVTRNFPGEERYGLTGQARRAAASIPANVAEGCGRDGKAELARFCTIALGSASELEYHLLLARDLGYFTAQRHQALCDDVNEVKRMLYAFIRSIKAND